MSSLGKDWSGSQMAPKSKEALGRVLETRKWTRKWYANSTLMCWKLVLVCSDCQGALGGYLVRSREVLYCREPLGELSRASSVKLLRVPGRSGVVVNEKADRLAIRGIRGVRATRCSMGLLECYLKELLEKWLEKIALKIWQEEKGMRQAKLLIREQPKKPVERN